MRDFEFDRLKSSRNKIKHGINFDEAKAIWKDSRRLELPARSLDETRFMVIGTAFGKTWSAFITYRGQMIRIISVRRARENERQKYEAFT